MLLSPKRALSYLILVINPYLFPSILMSSGPSLLNAKPRSAESNCIDEHPASIRTPSRHLGGMFLFSKRELKSLNLPRSGISLSRLKNSKIKQSVHFLNINTIMLKDRGMCCAYITHLRLTNSRFCNLYFK